MKNTTKTTKTQSTKSMTIMVDDKKKYIRFILDDNRVLCIAFKNSKSLNCYFHKDFTSKLSSIENIRVKSNIETHADDFELQLLVKSEDSLQTLKDLIAKKFDTKTTKVEYKLPETPAPKSEAPKTSEKKPATSAKKGATKVGEFQIKEAATQAS